MAWFNFFDEKKASTVAMADLPIFPLNTVLFPDGLLPLRVFEQRYLDMVAACMREDKPFGICLIDKGEETGKAAKPHAIGTLAHIKTWDMEQLGLLQLTVQGGRRFHIEASQVGENQLRSARVQLLPEETPQAIPENRQRLLPLLHRIVNEMGDSRIAQPHRFDDAHWVGYRYSEVLPIPNPAKQKLLELDDAPTRLEVLDRYLEQRGVLG